MAKTLKKFGDYQLIKKIATGGMAEIFLARTRLTDGPEKYVALKMIHPRYMTERNFHRMIVEEAKIAVQLNHPNIGQVFDLGKHNGRYFIVMEFIDGYDLSRLQEISREKALSTPIDAVAYIGREVCAALGYAHSRKDRSGRPLELIHRDISPQNILVSFDGEVKIIDFGIAKASNRLQQTHAGVIKGKFYYMSPEQAGASQVDQRSDLFSLGICLWETACGRSLFRRQGGPSNPLAILHEIRTMPIPRVREFRPDCPKVLEDIISMALSRDLDNRYTSANEMHDAFEQYLATQAPKFKQSSIADFMVRAFEKEETSKEINQPSTGIRKLMTRGEFFPTEQSVIFSINNLREGKAVIEPSNATRILANSEPILTNPKHDTNDSESGIVSGITESSSPAAAFEPVTDRNLNEITDDELALSDTVFIRKAEFEGLNEADAQPKAEDGRRGQLPELPDSDPNTRTYMLAQKDIQAAQDAHSSHPPNNLKRGILRRSISHQVDPPLTFTTHPLFRILVIALLVLCILSATLWLMLINRSRTAQTIQTETSIQIQKTKVSPPKTDISLSGSP